MHAQPRVISSGHSLLESPRWFDHRLVVSDFFTERVLAFSEDGTVEEVCHVPGRPSGLGWTLSGDLLVVSMLERRLMRWDGQELTEVADLTGIATGPCNDMVVDAKGRAYIGNFGFDDGQTDHITPAALIRVDPDGSVSVAATDLVFPNGMVMTPEGTLLVAETFAGRISAFDVDPDGVLSGRRVWADFAGLSPATTTEALALGCCLPDGMALDAEGRVWVADAARAGVLLVEEGGRVLDTVSLGDLTCFAPGFGGDDLSTLYLCGAIPYGTGDPSVDHRSTLFSMPVEVPGVSA